MAEGEAASAGALSTGRVEAFSDGVMGVAITLLALDLRLPADLHSNAEVLAGMWRLLPAAATWVVSFAFILTIWINHHYFFAGVKYVDRGLLWLNGFFLLTVTLIPFPTALVGAYPDFAAPAAFLSGTMLFASLSFTLMRFYVSGSRRMLRDHIDPGGARAALIRSALGPAIYGGALALAFVSPTAALGLQVVALLVFVFAAPNRLTPHGAKS